MIKAGMLLAALISPASAAPDGYTETMRAWHNGSTMFYEVVEVYHQRYITISYEEVRASLSQLVPPGTILFQGTLEGERAVGVAYLFKYGCSPFPYAVSGGFTRIERSRTTILSMTGFAPELGQGCTIKGMTLAPPHSRLDFHIRDGDARATDGEPR